MGRLCIGDIVCVVGRTRRMIVVDFDEAQVQLTTAWTPEPGAAPMEGVFHRSALVKIPIAPRP